MKLTTTTAKRLLKMVSAILLSFSFMSSTNAQGSVDLRFTPDATSVVVNQTFNVDVLMDISSGRYSGFAVFVNFDPTYLEVTQVSVPPATVTAFPAMLADFPSLAVMNAEGRVDYSRGTFSNFPTTDLVAATITFRAKAVPGSGSTTLSFNTAPGIRETDIGDDIGGTALNSVGTGTITITSSACTLPTAVISNTTTCSGAPFNLLLQSATGVGPWDLVVNGNTYNNVTVGSIITTITPADESLFDDSDLVDVTTGNDGSSITVGTRIRSDVAGVVKGIRFYRGIDNGTYTGYLYNNDGSQILATIVFPSGGADGWQQALFSSPVPIAANTNYVVAVYSTSGSYTVDEFFFNDEKTNGSHLTGPQNPGPGPNANGIYTYGLGFPGDTYNSSCYFVDMVFQPTEFNFSLTSVTDQSPCTNIGAPLQALTVNSPGCTLPVTMMNFSASASGSNAIRLNWATSSEQNNKGFEIRRSVTGQGNWETIGFVTGAGESNTMKNYSYLDQNLPARRYFYQLNQVDFDGRSKLSSVVSANLGAKDVFSLEQNFPNPFKGNETNIRFTLPHRSQVQLIVYDMNGRVIKTLVNGVKDAGTHAVTFQDNSLPTGIYFYKLTADGYSDVKKMTIR